MATASACSASSLEHFHPTLRDWFSQAFLKNEGVHSVESRGKHLLVHFDGGLALHSHLGMTGSWHIYRPNEYWQKPEHFAAIVLKLEESVVASFSPKTIELLSPSQLHRHHYLNRLGPDLLSRQFDGKELPEFATITGDARDNIESLESLVGQHGIELVYEKPGGGAKGVSQDGRIVVHPDLTEAEKFAVLVHVLAHELLHQQTGRKNETTKTIRETEAEVVAHVVCREVGMNGTTRSSDYIQLYSGDTKTLSESLDYIQKTAATHLDGISNHSNDEEVAA